MWRTLIPNMYKFSWLLPLFLDILLIRLKICKYNMNTQLCFLLVWYSDHIRHNLNEQRNHLWKGAHWSKRRQKSWSNSSWLKELIVIVLFQQWNNLNSLNMHSRHHDCLMEIPTPISFYIVSKPRTRTGITFLLTYDCIRAKTDNNMYPKQI